MSEICRYTSELPVPRQDDVITRQIATYGYSQKRTPVRQPWNQLSPLVIRTRDGNGRSLPSGGLFAALTYQGYPRVQGWRMGIGLKRGGTVALVCHCPLPITSFEHHMIVLYTGLSCRSKMSSEQEKEKGEKPARKGHAPNPNQKHCPKCGTFMKLMDLHTVCDTCRGKQGMNGSCDGDTEVCTECSVWTQQQKQNFVLSIGTKDAKGHKKKQTPPPPFGLASCRPAGSGQYTYQNKGCREGVPYTAGRRLLAGYRYGSPHTVGRGPG